MPYDRFSGGEERRGYHGNHNGKRPDGGPSGWTGTAQRNYGASRRPTVDPKRRMGEEALPRERENEAPENLLVGRNPIREALRAGRPLEKLLVMKGDLSGAARDIVRMAKDAGVVVQEVERVRLDQVYPNHQGLLAYASSASYSTLDEIFACAGERGEAPFLILLDGITDPHNLGAIIRTAECAGAHGVIIPKRRSVGLTAVVGKASAGALEYLPVARVANLVSAIHELQKAGVWVFGTAADGNTALYQADLKGPAAIVIGNEGDGMSRLVAEACDFKVSIPMRGRISSLNASNAAAILLYEAVRQRG